MQQMLLDRLRKEIPITSHMGIEVVRADNEEVSLSALLKPNINHNGTVFGGSLASVLLLSGWCLTEIRLKEWSLKGHVVVMKTELKYLHPVEGDFIATCSLHDEGEWQVFRQALESKKKARIRLEGSILYQKVAAVRFEGIYVAMLENF